MRMTGPNQQMKCPKLTEAERQNFYKFKFSVLSIKGLSYSFACNNTGKTQGSENHIKEGEYIVKKHKSKTRYTDRIILQNNVLCNAI